MRIAGSGILLAVGFLIHAGAAQDEPLNESFDRAVGEYVENHCVSCHSGSRPKGKLDLARFATAARVRAEPGLWRRVLDAVRRGDMPPPKRERPEKDETTAFVAWINGALPAMDTAPGRVTLRRLNRREYANTIRDLLGVDFPVHQRLPADDVGHGFDNIGDVLSLPPALLEKYVNAAEEIAVRAIALPQSGDASVMRVEGGDLEAKGSASRRRDGVWISSRGAAHAAFRFPRDGVYLLRVRAAGQQAGPEKCRMRVSVGNMRIDDVTIVAERDKPEIVELRARVKGGSRRFSAAFINDYYNPGHPDPKQRDRNLKVEFLEVEGPIDEAEPAPMQQRLVPDGSKELRPLVRALARRAFRRALADDDLDRLVAAIEAASPDGAGIERKMRIAIVAVLVSPRFLFRMELDDRPAAERALDDWELASRLSYFLWSSMPDDRLLDHAARGELRRPGVLAREARRMVRDARASMLAESFATQWLQIGRLTSVEFDPRVYPDVDADLKSAMRAESVLFFDAIVREDREVGELLDADFSYLNERLAKLYGVPGVRGPRMRRVRLDGRRGGGVLTQASVLACTSNPTRTSPVKRGKWVMQALLDAAPPPPPEAVALDESAQAVQSASVRKRLAIHRNDSACAVCHASMDVLGLALERFDGIGRWRDRDGKFAIDDTGTLPDGTQVNGVRGLRAVIAKDPRFERAFAKQLLTYALGRGVGAGDEPALGGVVETWGKGRRTIGRLIEAIVDSDTFRRRRPEDGRSEEGRPEENAR